MFFGIPAPRFRKEWTNNPDPRYRKLKKRAKNGEKITKKEFYDLRDNAFNEWKKKFDQRKSKEKEGDSLYQVLQRMDDSEAKIDLAVLLAQSYSDEFERARKGFDYYWKEPPGLID